MTATTFILSKMVEKGYPPEKIANAKRILEKNDDTMGLTPVYDVERRDVMYRTREFTR